MSTKTKSNCFLLEPCKKVSQACVFLVGAGPGSPDLLTVKALRIIENCDVILYDNLVSKEIVSLISTKVKKIFVGKKSGDHSMKQSGINELMIDLYRKGKRVCRLKGGDPFMFGRGSEELLALKNLNIKVEVVPGITAASACSGYSGIPLTHRGVSQGCTFLTGHADKQLDLNWKSIVQLNHTIVFYMGLSELNIIQKNLMSQGMSGFMPAALIENGTSSSQRVVKTTLNDLAKKARQYSFKSPTLIIVGQVVKFHDLLNWFEEELVSVNQINKQFVSA